MPDRPRIAHISGPTATIQNAPPLVTSNKARTKYGLPPYLQDDGRPPKYDALRPQRLGKPTKVYIEQFSAHPLESDAASLYGPPDGYLGRDGSFSTEPRAEDDKPVYEVELCPVDGLYPLPYMARQADGAAWEHEGIEPLSSDLRTRQTFYPDGTRSFEEIDRMGVDDRGFAGILSGLADIDFHRVLPPGGYRRGEQKAGASNAEPESRGKDFFPYKPFHLNAQPPRPALARVTNAVQTIMGEGSYDGAIWTQGTPSIEEMAYWFNLLIDTSKPIVCVAAQRPQGQLGSDGPQNICDAARYIASNVWRGAEGANAIGTVLVQDQQVFAAREVAKADARPGGYIVTGGLGGIVGQITYTGRVIVNYAPRYKFCHLSDLTLRRMPFEVACAKVEDGRLRRVVKTIRGGDGSLSETSIPVVSIIKDGGFSGLDWDEDPSLEVDLKASIDQKLCMGLLAGFVVEGLTPYGGMTSGARLALMRQAVMSGLPVARVGRGHPEGFADRHPHFIAGANLTSIKARLLLMAALLKFGSLPLAKDPRNPTSTESAATADAVAVFQHVFDTH
jgi:L-asparaginase